jgi:hypothetical protein
VRDACAVPAKPRGEPTVGVWSLQWGTLPWTATSAPYIAPSPPKMPPYLRSVGGVIDERR